MPPCFPAAYGSLCKAVLRDVQRSARRFANLCSSTAITQLFRLPSNTTKPSTPTTAISSSAMSSLASLASDLAVADGSAELEMIRALVLEQANQIQVLAQQVNDPQKYRHLGKPVVSVGVRTCFGAEDGRD